MNWGDIKIGVLYECTDLLGFEVRDWHRSQPTPLELRIEYPKLFNGDLFIIIEITEVKKNKEGYDVKVLTAKGDIGWLFLWKQYKFPANIVDTSEKF